MQAVSYWPDPVNLQHLLMPIQGTSIENTANMQHFSEQGEQVSDNSFPTGFLPSPKNVIGSGKARGKSSGDKKHSLATQSKSSAAQKRYRERQKDKMEVFRKQVADLSKKLQSLQTENETLEERNRLLEKVMQLKDRQSQTMDTHEEQPEQSTSLFVNTKTELAAADYFNTVRRADKPVTLQEASKISPEDLRQVRLDYIKELAKMLLNINDGKNTEGMRQLEDYVLSVRLTCINLIQSMSVRSFAQLISMKKSINQTSFVSERIMAAMNLSWDQRRDYVKARRALLARNESIREKRRELVGRIEEAIPGEAPLMSGQKATMLNACESSDQFKASLEEEHRSMGQFHIDCVQVLTPLQEARMLIEAHPGSPDLWLISGYLEAEQKGTLNAWLQEHLGRAEQISPNRGQAVDGIPQVTHEFKIVSEPEDCATPDSYDCSPDVTMNTSQLLPCQQATASASYASDSNELPEGVQWRSDLSAEQSSCMRRNGTCDSDQTYYMGQDIRHQGMQEHPGMYKQFQKQHPYDYPQFVEPFPMGPVVSLNQVESTDAMQNSQAGLQNLLEAPSLDILDNLPDFNEDGMWLDLFPGLLTQN